MADNTTLNLGSGGDVIATDDIGGVKHQLVKLEFGAADSATQVSAAAPLPVVQTGTLNVGTVTTVTTVAAVTAISNALPAGTNAIGKLAANSGVDIGDVDVTSVVPGTSATSLGKAVDSVAGATDTGVTPLYVRQDTLSALTPAVGDYAPAKVNANGAQWVAIGAGGIAGQVDDAAITLGTAEGIPIVGAYSSTRDLIDSGDGGILAISVRRAMYVIGDTLISTANSTTSNLAGAATFTGTGEDVSDFSTIQINVFSSHASATDGLSLQQSSDNTNWDHTDTFTIAATTGKLISLPVQARYFRLVYTNGGTLTTSLRIQVMYKAHVTKGSAQRPGDAMTNENDQEMCLTFGMGYNGTTWDRLRSVNTGYLGVTPHYAGTAASTGTGASGAQTQRVVTATDSTIGTVTTCSTLTNITNWGNIVDDAAFTPATTRVSMSGFQADETGTDSVDEGDAGAARMTLDRKLIVTQQPHTQGGLNTAAGSITTTVTSVKASAGQLYGYYIYNPNASVAYCQIFDLATGSVTLGTTTPKLSFGIPASSAANVTFPSGVAFGTAISIAFTTTRAGSTAPGSSVDYNFYHF